MEEPVDVYSDQFQINLNAYGCTLNFLISSPSPPAPGAVPQIDRLATVRMSLEYLKIMAFLLHRQLIQYEQQTGVSIPLPIQILTSLQIRQEDWHAFWQA